MLPRVEEAQKNRSVDELQLVCKTAYRRSGYNESRNSEAGATEEEGEHRQIYDHHKNRPEDSSAFKLFGNFTGNLGWHSPAEESAL